MFVIDENGRAASLNVDADGNLKIAGGTGGVGGGGGDASAANQTTEIARLTTLVSQTDGIEGSLTSIDGKTPALGQALAAASVPVVLPAAQVTALTPPAAITGFATATNQTTGNTSLSNIDGKLPALSGGRVPVALPSTAVKAKSGGDEYETVAASQTNQTLGATGAAGDYLEGILCVVATAATSQVSIKDGSNTAIVVLPNAVGAGVGSYYVPLGLTSTSGGWQITTGAGVSVIGMGDFT